MSDSKFTSLLVFLGVLFVPVIIGSACYAIEVNDNAAYERMVLEGIPAEIAACVDHDSESYYDSDACFAHIMKRYAEEQYTCKLVSK